MFFPHCLVPGCRIPSELPPSEAMTAVEHQEGVKGAWRFPAHIFHCAPPAGVFVGRIVYCIICVAVSGLKLAHEQVAGASVAVLTLPFLDAEQLPVPPLRTQGQSLALLFISQVQVPCGTAALWYIIVASILRIASRNVGGSGFSSLLVLTLHLQTQFLSFRKVRLFFFPCIITENCHRVNVVLKWRQMKVHVSWMKTVFILSDFYRWYLLTSASLLVPRGVESVL